METMTSLVLDAFERLDTAKVEDIRGEVRDHHLCAGKTERELVRAIGKAVYSLNKSGRIAHVGPSTYRFETRAGISIKKSRSRPEEPVEIDPENEREYDEYGPI